MRFSRRLRPSLEASAWVEAAPRRPRHATPLHCRVSPTLTPRPTATATLNSLSQRHLRRRARARSSRRRRNSWRARFSSSASGVGRSRTIWTTRLSRMFSARFVPRRTRVASGRRRGTTGRSSTPRRWSTTRATRPRRRRDTWRPPSRVSSGASRSAVPRPRNARWTFAGYSPPAHPVVQPRRRARGGSRARGGFRTRVHRHVAGGDSADCRAHPQQLAARARAHPPAPRSHRATAPAGAVVPAFGGVQVPEHVATQRGDGGVG